MRIGRVASGGFGDLLRDGFQEELDDTHDKEWWTKLRDQAPDEGVNLLRYHRAALMIANRRARDRRARWLGLTLDDMAQIAWLGILIGLRTWHKRPPNCKSQLAWCIRNADWFSANQLKAADAKIRRCPRIVLQSDYDIGDRLSGYDPHTFDEIVTREKDRRRPTPQDLTIAGLGLTLLREANRHRLADILEARIFDQLTLQQIGDQVGITRERVRQLEAEAGQRLCFMPKFVEAAKAMWPGWMPPRTVSTVAPRPPEPMSLSSRLWKLGAAKARTKRKLALEQPNASPFQVLLRKAVKAGIAP